MKRFLPFVLLLAASSLAAQEQPARHLLGWCRGIDGPTGLLVETRAQLVQGGTQWSAQLVQLEAQGERTPQRTQSAIVDDVGFMPAMPGLSWQELSDGTSRLWTRELSAWAQPAGSGMAVLSVEKSSGPCEGAAFMLDFSSSAPVGSAIALLVVPREAVALTSLSDGRLLSMPLLATSPGRRKVRRAPAPMLPGALRADERLTLERVDTQRAGGLIAGRAWRVMTLPSHSAGRLTSERFQVLEEKGRVRVLHHVRGALELDRGNGELEGVVVEVLQ